MYADYPTGSCIEVIEKITSIIVCIYATISLKGLERVVFPTP
jgi:hypothetical protein